MCMQCVAAGATYLVPTVAGLQVYKAAVRRKRRTRQAQAAPTR